MSSDSTVDGDAEADADAGTDDVVELSLDLSTFYEDTAPPTSRSSTPDHADASKLDATTETPTSVIPDEADAVGQDSFGAEASTQMEEHVHAASADDDYDDVDFPTLEETKAMLIAQKLAMDQRMELELSRAELAAARLPLALSRAERASKRTAASGEAAREPEAAEAMVETVRASTPFMTPLPHATSSSPGASPGCRRPQSLLPMLSAGSSAGRLSVSSASSDGDGVRGREAPPFPPPISSLRMRLLFAKPFR